MEGDRGREEIQLVWVDPETEYIESPVKVTIKRLAAKWHLNDPNYPDNTHALSTYTTLLSNRSVSKSWRSRRKACQKKRNRVVALLPGQKAILTKAQVINQRHFDALEKALAVYNIRFERLMEMMEENPLGVTAGDFKQLTAAMLDIQKGQRLAAGMVTERIGYVSEEQVKAAFRQVTGILIFIFDAGKVPVNVREAAMQRLESAIDIGE